MIPLSFFSTVIVWAPYIGQIVVFIFLLSLYIRREKIEETYVRSLISLGLTAVVFWVLYAILLTAIQYWTWTRDPVGSILLSIPLQNAGDFWFFEGKLGYFIFYVFKRYWLNLFVSVFFGGLFFLFLRFLARYRDRFFEKGETVLGGVLAFLVGWPANLIFVGLSFVIVVVLSIFRMVSQKQTLTTLGIPFLVSAGAVILFSQVFLLYTGLTVLNI